MKKKDIELIFKGADDQSFQELLDDLRPQGEWRKRSHGFFRCTNCEQYSSFDFPFCPNCGANMRGEKE